MAACRQEAMRDPRSDPTVIDGTKAAHVPELHEQLPFLAAPKGKRFFVRDERRGCPEYLVTGDRARLLALKRHWGYRDLDRLRLLDPFAWAAEYIRLSGSSCGTIRVGSIAHHVSARRMPRVRFRAGLR